MHASATPTPEGGFFCGNESGQAKGFSCRNRTTLAEGHSSTLTPHTAVRGWSLPHFTCSDMRFNYKFVFTAGVAYALLGGEFYYEQDVAGSDPAFAGNLPPTLAKGVPFGLGTVLVYIVSSALFARYKKATWVLSTYLHAASAVCLGILLGYLYYQLRTYISPAPGGLCAFCPGELKEPPFVVQMMSLSLIVALPALLIGLIARSFPPSTRDGRTRAAQTNGDGDVQSLN